jgi:hypothetical protein
MDLLSQSLRIPGARSEKQSGVLDRGPRLARTPLHNDLPEADAR